MPELFVDRGEAIRFLLGAAMIPLGLILTFVLNIVFVGTGPKDPTPAWVPMLSWIALAGFVLMVLPIGRFTSRPVQAPDAQAPRHPTMRAFGLYFSGEGIREAFRIVRAPKSNPPRG